MSDGYDTAMMINKMFDIECSANEAIELEQHLFKRMTSRVDELEQALERISGGNVQRISTARYIARTALGRG